jgi:hypothetical protein
MDKLNDEQLYLLELAYWAGLRNDQINIVEYALQQGFSPNAKNKETGE